MCGRVSLGAFEWQETGFNYGATSLFPTFHENRKCLGVGADGGGTEGDRIGGLGEQVVMRRPDPAGIEETAHDACLDGEVDVLRDVARNTRDLERVKLADHDAHDPTFEVE